MSLFTTFLLSYTKTFEHLSDTQVRKYFVKRQKTRSRKQLVPMCLKIFITVEFMYMNVSIKNTVTQHFLFYLVIS